MHHNLIYSLNNYSLHRLASPLGHRSIDAFVGLNWEDTNIQIYGPELGRKSLADELKDICEEKEHLDVLAAFPPTSA